jgi:hypothetical protein
MDNKTGKFDYSFTLSLEENHCTINGTATVKNIGDYIMVSDPGHTASDKTLTGAIIKFLSKRLVGLDG